MNDPSKEQIVAMGKRDGEAAFRKYAHELDEFFHATERAGIRAERAERNRRRQAVKARQQIIGSKADGKTKHG